MTKEVAGISLESLEGPICTALAEYSEMTDSGVRFEIDQAARLELTPDKPNSARSVSNVLHNGEVATQLYVIAFAPLNATGDEKTYQKEDLTMGMYPRTAGFVPRSKASTETEAHLTIVSKDIEQPHRDPVLFAGNLGLLSVMHSQLMEVARLGQDTRSFVHDVWDRETASPRATLSVGYEKEADGTKGERFGDPHTVYNPWVQLVQVCGFIAIRPDQAAKHGDIFEQLGAVEPTSSDTYRTQ